MSLFFHVVPDWFALVSLACCIGALVCSLWVVGTARGDAISAQEDLLAGMRQVLRIGAVGLFVSSLLGLLVYSAEMSGYPIAGAVPALPTVLFRTHLGHAWVLRMAAIVALSVTTLSPHTPNPSRPSRMFMLGCAVVVSATNAATGHASDAGDLSAAEFMDWLHLVAALVWGGGLIVLSSVILPPLVKQGDGAAWSMATVASRFSQIAWIGAGFIVVTASYQEWTYGGGVEGLASSAFGWTIVAKIVLFSFLLVLGAFNRYISVPRLQVWAGCATASHQALGRPVAPALLPFARDVPGPLAAARFTRRVQLEAFLLIAVLLCAALLRHEAPSRHAPHVGHHALAHDSTGSQRPEPMHYRPGDPPLSSLRQAAQMPPTNEDPTRMPPSPPAVEVREDAQGAAVVVPRGALDVGTASRARRELIARLEGRSLRSLEIDARGLERGDVSGMVILYELRSGMFTQGVRGRIVGLRPELEKLLAAFPSEETLRRMEAGPAPVGVRRRWAWRRSRCCATPGSRSRSWGAWRRRWRTRSACLAGRASPRRCGCSMPPARTRCRWSRS